jgi:short-chain fatty acids transporter
MERLGRLFAGLSQRYLPDAVVLACLLTLLTLLIAVGWPQVAELQNAGTFARIPPVAAMWMDGVWNRDFLAFALQMCFVLLTGYGLAKAPLAGHVIRRIAGWPRSNRGAVFLIAFTSCVTCWINWGFGLIVSGLLAVGVGQRLAERGVRCQYPLIVAAAYLGMMIWHGGLSGSAPLRVNDQGVRITRLIDGRERTEQTGPIDIRGTTLSPGNLILSGLLIVGIPLVIRVVGSREVGAEAADGIGAGFTEPADPTPAATPGPAAAVSDATIAARLNRTPVVPLLIVGLVALALGVQLRDRGAGAIGLNFVNLLFLGLGLLLHRNLSAYVSALAEGGRAISGIVLQFPLYAGIQGVMHHAGIASAISQGFVDASQWTASALGVGAEPTFAVSTFLSAGLVNLFVPSGGGQWIVQGPIVCSAAADLAIPLEKAVMAVAYGDQWTNMIQPFWAIPLMGLTRVDVRQFIGYCALLMLLAGPVFALALVLL